MVFGRTGLPRSKVVKCSVAEYFLEKLRWCLVEPNGPDTLVCL